MRDLAEYNAYMSKYMSARYHRRKAEAIAYMGGQCQHCGYSKCIAALEFHHRDPHTKEFEWRKMRLLAWDAVLAELDKCDLVCSNCHKELHFDERIHIEAQQYAEAIARRKQEQQIVPRNCERCNTVFETREPNQRFCSADCSSKSRMKIVWPIDLPELVAVSSKAAVARMLGVSDKAVNNRLVRYHSENRM